MRPKGKLLALVVMFAAVGLITATGAFTTVTAERTATVDVAGDSAALLALQANSSYADNNAGNGASGGSQLQINLDNPGSAQGLNPNANTTFEYAFNVTNNGNNDINLDVTIDSDSDLANSVIVEAEDGTDLTTETKTMGIGDTVEIHLKFVLTNDEGPQVDELSSSEDIPIVFEANEA